MIELDLTHGWRLAGDLSEREVALAAAELEAALGAPADDGVEIVLSHGNGAGEAFRRQAAPERVELYGESPRAVLLATYTLLEELGVRWPWPGEPPPRPQPAQVEAGLQDSPAVPGRCLVLGERAVVDAAEEWIVWAARNRLNTIFIHVTTRRAAAGAAPEATWRVHRDEAVTLARERAMTIEHGGHLLPELLSRDDLRALADGRPPTPDARRTLEQHVRARPEADVLHLWGADLPSRGGARHASQAALRTANAVAAIAEEVRPATQVAFLAYHDTEDVPAGVQPRRNVCLLFAPRERCYRHSLTDCACPRNRRYRDLLAAHIEHFAAAGAAPPRVFEYWFDAIRFGTPVPDLTDTMAEDIAFYGAAGVHTVQMLMTGHGRPPAPHPNPRAFGRLTWDLSATPGSKGRSEHPEPEGGRDGPGERRA